MRFIGSLFYKVHLLDILLYIVQFVGDENPMPTDSNGEYLVEVHDLVEAWRGMESLAEDGLAKAIGVSNFNIAQIERIQNVAKVPISNLQVFRF